jgi:hypothetical protein
MIRFDWNGLTVGERVDVTEHVRTDRHRVAGTVAFVQQRSKSNAVGIRIDRTPNRVLWPTRHEVERADPDRPAAAHLTEQGGLVPSSHEVPPATGRI